MADIEWVIEEIFRLLAHNKEQEVAKLQMEAEQEYMKLTRKLKQVDRSKLTFLENLLKCTYLKDWKRAKWNLDGAKSQYTRFILPFWQNEKDYQRHLESQKRERPKQDPYKDRIELDYATDDRIPYHEDTHVQSRQPDSQSEYHRTQRVANGNEVRRIQSERVANDNQARRIQSERAASDIEVRRIQIERAATDNEVRRIQGERDATRQHSYLGLPRRDMRPAEIHERIKFSSYERNSNDTAAAPKKKVTHASNNPDASEIEELVAKNMAERKEITRRFNELYSKEYQTALTDIQAMGIHEKKATACLIHIVQDAYTMCKAEAESQMKQIYTAMITIIGEGKLKVLETSSHCKGDEHLLLQYRKDVASMSIKKLQQDFSNEQLLSVLYGTNVTLKKDGSVEAFVNKCVLQLWWMVVQDPPMYVYEGRDSRFNPELFKEYKTTGSVVEFYRWPAVLSHKDGKVLAKGIAECH